MIQRYTHYDHSGNDATHPEPDDEGGRWCSNTDVAALEAENARLQASLAEQESRANLHADLNRRVAEALGRPTDGAVSSWHDMPEGIMALRGQIESLKNLELAQLLRQERKDNVLLQASLAALRKAARPFLFDVETWDLCPDNHMLEIQRTLSVGAFRTLARAMEDTL